MNLEKIKRTQERYQELEQILADPKIFADNKRYQALAKEMSDITELVTLSRQYEDVVNQQKDLDSLLKEKHDQEFEDLAHIELEDLEEKKQALELRLDDLLNPKKEEKERDIIMEIRAGTGGAEASLFAGDLYRMYTKYAAIKGWKVESISSHPAEAGGFKEVVFSVSGKGVWKCLRWESGAHRVQRVPSTEASGRIHTSAATVVVLSEPEEVELNIDPKNLKIDVFRASGPGGQSVNTTDSAIRITHIPTGTVVICQDERSQLKNKMKAMRVLRARILDRLQQENQDKEAKERKEKVGTGDRSDKIRTYNFPDRRITDHRIGFTTHQLPNVLDGNFDELADA
ncbi:MAG: peptide chain release factor 1, partial [Candidatus Omnitrophica bacterium]|nr:peptide chain release factor 1 [Candidatus Omnitrophota bacterium]